jgi:hypothetical protein
MRRNERTGEQERERDSRNSFYSEKENLFLLIGKSVRRK